MSQIPIHPRLAHMVVKGKELGLGALACDVAALLEERDLLRGDTDTDIDLYARWYVLRNGGRCDKFARDRALAQSKRLREIIGSGESVKNEDKLGVLLALAYPERVAKRRDEKYQLASGTVAILPKGSLLAREPFLAIGDVDGSGNSVRVFLAAAITEKDVLEVFSERLRTEEEIQWDEGREKVIARRVAFLGSIELSESPIHPTPEQIGHALLDGIRAMGIGSLNWTKAATSFRARSEWLRKSGFVDGEWPNIGDQHLLNTMEVWLLPFLGGISRRSQIEGLDLPPVLKSLFSHRQLQEVDRLAPTHLTVPSGSRIALDYSGERPVLGVRLQEMFGELETPTVAGGRVKVVVHLLSPAHRPLAVTQDLPSFWKNAYPEVRKDMRGQYPKHHWPEDPLEATPTKHSKLKR
jgi:ATP-dependent helicase HrpB